MNKANRVRWRFAVEFGRGLLIVWPVLSGVVLLMVLLGFCCARDEHWPFGDGLYFALITGFTVGYGDFVPHHPLARACAVCLAFLGIVMTAIIAAAAVKALGIAQDSER
ncbi:MAG: potassium channel family protein [Chthoniobacter sp.]|uniref:potassium channel family protein n=1 Tax=Chthoniobacter sp. TaxID=2510640 RepID=UPI0032A4D819